MAPRPDLYPLKTSKDIIFPSELQEASSTNTSSSENGREEGSGPSVPPPLAYTEFLRALSPAFGSPDGPDPTTTRWSFGRPLSSPASIPSSASSASFQHGDDARASSTPVPASPPAPPRSASSVGFARRFRVPPPYIASVPETPQTPYMAHTPMSPADWRLRRAEPSNGANGRTITVQHIVTHTITLKHAPSLDPAPRGKRRRTHDSEDN
ncbi:hypothetical protein ANOM_005006 [Aspergillus nomiae NRRL 13137]|uniref:Uncharacterized protein n=1 Tax=Aspergillus nomiae NRRL (strain ATCC 15546 / NRRL 13137 / CBS 260.88 / M93) TaxID=1509407 RepID=A0A0L1J7R7_ASPN3|nr:uncharacterized protein ANOM_005006 [Aspergillus nomiae NRRL 13137]KNG87730.1 hypothetical protein ANOM_005006 [Aspergillus nomiae NRRL 13137]